MSSRLDKLFKDKLAEHVQAPSADAWAKVEAGLAKKNNGFGWYQIAAAVTLLATLASAIVWMASREENPAVRISQVTKQKKVVVEQHQTEQTHKSAVKRPTAKHKAEPQPRIELSPAPVAITRDTTAQQLLVEVPAQPESEVAPITSAPAVAAIEKTERTIVLEYKLESIEPEKPDAKQIVADAREKKGIQKVLDFAWDAKNSDGAVSELRQAKDEFFAFNFRKDKQKTSK